MRKGKKDTAQIMQQWDTRTQQKDREMSGKKRKSHKNKQIGEAAVCPKAKRGKRHRRSKTNMPEVREEIT